jgi:hypothetical protein
MPPKTTYGHRRRWAELYAQAVTGAPDPRGQLEALRQAAHGNVDPDHVGAVQAAFFAANRCGPRSPGRATLHQADALRRAAGIDDGMDPINEQTRRERVDASVPTAVGHRVMVAFAESYGDAHDHDGRHRRDGDDERDLAVLVPSR